MPRHAATNPRNAATMPRIIHVSSRDCETEGAKDGLETDSRQESTGGER